MGERFVYGYSGQLDCPDCDGDFSASKTGMKGLYWHLRHAHGYTHLEAYDAVAKEVENGKSADPGFRIQEW